MAISEKDFERITDLFFMMLNQARNNRELALSARRDVREGTYSQEKQRARRRKPRKPTANDRKLSRAMKEAYKKSHKKNGGFKKGWNRSKMLKEAHRLRRKMK